jgi:hypothetical protein
MKETSLINIVEDEEPLSIIFGAQPVTNKRKGVCSRILATRDPHAISNLPIALMDWELLGDAVAEQSKAAVQTPKKVCDLFHSSIIALLVH